MKKLIVFDLDGTLAASKSAVELEMSGLLARPSSDRQSGGDFRRRLAAVRKATRFESASRQTPGESISPSYLRHKVLSIRFNRLEKDLFGRFHYRSKRKDPRFFKEGDRSCRLQDRKALGRANRRPGKPNNIFRLGSARSLGRKGNNGILISPSGRRLKRFLTLSFPSFLSESGARHRLTLPGLALTKPTASENFGTCSVFR